MVLRAFFFQNDCFSNTSPYISGVELLITYKYFTYLVFKIVSFSLFSDSVFVGAEHSFSFIVFFFVFLIYRQGDASPMNIRKQHAECVKTKALASVKAVRQVTDAEARAAVDRVFERCYSDLEPIGRRIRRNSADMIRAYNERGHYGYE